jgi:hypothetical protein
MTPENYLHQQELSQLANKLFMFTDAQQWQKLLDEVFVDEIWFDMSSIGAGEPKNIKAKELCEMWRQGFVGLDAVHHQAGHYIIEVNQINALIFGYAVAFHYKKSALNGNTRSFVGSYDLVAIRTDRGWRLSSFKYNLKFIDGNPDLT